MAKVVALLFTLVLCLLVEVEYTGAQPTPTTTLLGDINGIDIQLVNGSAPNEGRVLVRLLPDSPWTAVCYDPNFSHAIPFQMCRRIGYKFACSQDYAGVQRTDDLSLVGVLSQSFLASCAVNPSDRAAGGCTLVPFRQLDPSFGRPCTHDQDMWLSCGYAGMPDFELRLAEGSYRDPSGLLQGRCGVEHEWSTICGNEFQRLKQGRVACRELGYSDQAMSTGYVRLARLDAQHKPNYTLFVDVGCIGNESSLTQCQHYSLRECEGYVTLECYTAITEYDETVYLCGSKQICSAQCEQIHPIPGYRPPDDQFHYCQCDDVCSLFDDCCYDYAAICNPGLPSLEQGGFTLDHFGCVWVPGSQFTHIGYLAVDHCPISWTDGGTRDLCERPVDITDVIGSLPVFDERGVDFKNIYCAICNGRPLEILKRWGVSVSDNNRVKSDKRSYPSLNATLPTKGWVITPPQEHTVIRECPAHLVDTCLDEFRGTQVEEACRAYYAPVKLEDSDIRYRNPHCGICNNRNVIPANSCRDQTCSESCSPDPWGPCQGVCGPYDDFLLIEVLFDFTSSSSITGVSCNGGEIYDPFIERCRVLTCATGYHIKDDECVVAPSISPTPTNNSTTPVADCLSETSGSNNSHIFVFETDQILSLSNPNYTTFSAYVLVNSASEASDIEFAFDDAIKTIANSSLHSTPLPCNVSDLSIILPFSFNESSTCSYFILDGSKTFPGYNGTLLTVVRFQNTLKERNYSKERVPPLCLKVNDLNCSSLLTLGMNEYKVLTEETIQVIATGTRLSYMEYVIFPDGVAVVCSFIGPVPEGLEPQIRRAISFIGSILSLLALAATFVTYCVLPELRNVAGLSTMNMVVALFTAILMFLLSGYLRQNQAACEFGAIVAHFAWLAAFFWMTILSFNAAKTLSSMLPRSGRSSGIRRSLVAYICLAWGIPVIVVSICLILQYCDCTNVPVIYAEGGICWITDVGARLVAFVVPISLSLALNVCFFVFAIVSLRRTRKGTMAVRNQSNLEGAKEELTIYAKLCALVGVTWVFGFIAQSVTGIIVFSYIYIIVNYFQGVFIFIAFCLNKRVRGMWRENMRRRRRKPRKENTSDTKLVLKSSAVTTTTEHTENTDM